MKDNSCSFWDRRKWRKTPLPSEFGINFHHDLIECQPAVMATTRLKICTTPTQLAVRFDSPATRALRSDDSPHSRVVEHPTEFCGLGLIEDIRRYFQITFHFQGNSAEIEAKVQPLFLLAPYGPFH